jgi:cytochrome c553
MNSERLFSWKNHWFSLSVGVTAGLVVLSLITGFVILPYATSNAQFTGIWDAICSAAGVPRATTVSEPVKSSSKTSDVVLSTQLAGPPDTRAVGRGATLAMQCAICHGSSRQSQVDTPNLEGQPVAAVYKQLRDFKEGVRTNAVMSPFAVKLSEQDMLDIAAYYAYLPRQPGTRPDDTVTAPLIVVRGAAMRNIPACSSCHGDKDFKAGSPWLDGQSAVYIKAQLQAYALGTRRNDISEQMRNVARRMTPQEIDEAARYFASRP